MEETLLYNSEHKANFGFSCQELSLALDLVLVLKEKKLSSSLQNTGSAEF